MAKREPSFWRTTRGGWGGSGTAAAVTSEALGPCLFSARAGASGRPRLVSATATEMEGMWRGFGAMAWEECARARASAAATRDCMVISVAGRFAGSGDSRITWAATGWGAGGVVFPAGFLFFSSEEGSLDRARAGLATATP